MKKFEIDVNYEYRKKETTALLFLDDYEIDTMKDEIVRLFNCRRDLINNLIIMRCADDKEIIINRMDEFRKHFIH